MSALDQVQADGYQIKVKNALALLPEDEAKRVNVSKLNLKTGRLSLLEYEDFEESHFPALRSSWVRANGETRSLLFRSYEQSLNPPILHRKELLVGVDHPRWHAWSALTREAEELGLFDDISTIGFQQNWDRLVASKGYEIAESGFIPIGNDTSASGSTEAGDNGISGPIQRHRTALSRVNLSAPVQLLLRHGLLTEESSFFDYGCGRGDDMAGLTAEGLSVGGWDPHYAADFPIHEADVVNLGFVVNVIEDPAERVEALLKAFALARRVLSVSVMLFGGDCPGRRYGDGYITSRNTFQKYFSQGEFKDWLEHALHREVVLVGPGIAFAFADEEAEQRFLAGRYRASGIATRLLLTQRRATRLRALRPPRPQRVSRQQQLLEEFRPTLESIWVRALDLGRYPEPDEAPDITVLQESLGSYRKVIRLLDGHFDGTLLESAARSRSDDLRVFFAMQQFGKRRKYRQLEYGLQRDIKAFFGDYATARSAGLQLLLEAANVEHLLEACQEAASRGLGWLDGQHSLQFHISLVERLPAVLRVYVGCGLLIYGELGPVDLIKIHIGSGKLTLMEFEDFAERSLPRMTRRIKVNIRLQDFDVFEYASPQFPKPLLYWKSRFINEDSPGFAEQQIFDERLDASGLLADETYGPSEEELSQELELARLAIINEELVDSETIPDLDQRCGKYFCYRDFIECGETQHRLATPNIPKSPKTFNAIYALATQVMDPIVDYFGGVKLTYGFCSPDMSKHIKSRVAPKLDQHASYEVNRRGLPICDRGGAACDFLIDDEDMSEVADWIIENLPFDRLYFYGAKRPIHVSFAPGQLKSAYAMIEIAPNRAVPKPYNNSSA